nr:thioesterase domain-containing protein [uncultured Lachnoclostridium sp.]
MKKLLVLPYAGGSAQIIANKLRKYMGVGIDIVPIELPGRGRRSGEKLLTNFNEVMDDILPQIFEIINNGDKYALFGYSMGSLIIYELYYGIERKKWNTPEMMFFCASNPPKEVLNKHKLDSKSIINEMINLGGTDKIILNNPEIMEYIIPIMRADFKVMNSYTYMKHRKRLECPISIQYGIDDDIIDNVDSWRDYTNAKCDFKYYDSGHFFINSYSKEMADYIKLCNI